MKRRPPALALALAWVLAWPAWAQDLSPTAASEAPAKAELSADQGRLASDLEGQKKSLADLDRKASQALEGLATSGQRLKDLNERSTGLEKELRRAQADLEALKTAREADKLGTEDSLKRMEELAADLSDKRERMAGIADLMQSIKRDVNDNAQEIVELKRQVKSLSGGSEEGGRGSSLDNAIRWPYLPLVATALSTVAIFLSLRH